MTDDVIELHSEEFEDLAAGHAVGALETNEVARFSRHCQRCDVCSRLVAEHVAVVSVLPRALDDMPTSPPIKERLMEQVRREAAAAAPRLAPSKPDSVVRLERRAPRPRVAWALSVAASLILMLGVGAWNLQLQRELANVRARGAEQAEVLRALAAGGRAWKMTPSPQSSGATGLVVLDPNTSQLIVHAEGLPALPSDRAYEAWVLRDGAMKPAGLVAPGNSGTFTLRLNANPQVVRAVALSLEPAAGTESPTGPVMLITEL